MLKLEALTIKGVKCETITCLNIDKMEEESGMYLVKSAGKYKQSNTINIKQ